MARITANTEPNLKLRLIIEQDDVRQLVLQSVRQSVQELCVILKSDFGLDVEFKVHYLDPDSNEDGNLSTISKIKGKMLLESDLYLRS